MRCQASFAGRSGGLCSPPEVDHHHRFRHHSSPAHAIGRHPASDSERTTTSTRTIWIRSSIGSTLRSPTTASSSRATGGIRWRSTPQPAIAYTTHCDECRGGAGSRSTRRTTSYSRSSAAVLPSRWLHGRDWCDRLQHPCACRGHSRPQRRAAAVPMPAIRGSRRFARPGAGCGVRGDRREHRWVGIGGAAASVPRRQDRCGICRRCALRGGHRCT